MPQSRYVQTLNDTSFRWYPLASMGWIPVGARTPKVSYFAEYQKLDGTKIAERLNEFRVRYVREFTTGHILDIGIGSGAFLTAHGNCCGYDVDPMGVTWLENTGLYVDPYDPDCDLSAFGGVTFWDSLEHIEAPELLLDRITTQYVFVSIPIFRNLGHVLRSKHHKPNEHYFYFTDDGIRLFMVGQGFKFMASSNEEQVIGREDIMTYVFRRPEVS